MRFGQFIFIFLVILWSAASQAAEYQLELLESVAIYAQPKAGAKVVGYAEVGEKLSTERLPKNNFYSVEFITKGKKRRGYISVDEAGFSQVSELKGSLRSHYTLGLSAIYSSAMQGARTLDTSPDTQYNISEFKGSSAFFRIFSDMPLSRKFAVRLALVLRQTEMEGDAQLAGGTSVLQFHLEQTLIGGEVLFKGYLFGSERFWAAPGLEISKGTKVSLETKSGPPIDDSGVEKPLFFILSGSAGYDIPIYSAGGGGGFYFTPEMRLGGIVTTDPITFLFEAVLNGCWAF